MGQTYSNNLNGSLDRHLTGKIFVGFEVDSVQVETACTNGWWDNKQKLWLPDWPTETYLFVQTVLYTVHRSIHQPHVVAENGMASLNWNEA